MLIYCKHFLKAVTVLLNYKKLDEYNFYLVSFKAENKRNGSK